MVHFIALGLLLCNIQLAQGEDFSDLIKQRRLMQAIASGGKPLLPAAIGCDNTRCMCGEQCSWIGDMVSCSGNCSKEELQFIAFMFPKPKPEDTQSSTKSPTIQPQ